MTVSKSAAALPFGMRLAQAIHKPATALPLGMRLVQTYYAITLVCGLGFAALCNPADFAYDLSMLRAIVHMVVAAQATWLIWHRAKGGQTFCLVGTTVCLALSLADLFVCGAWGEIASRIGTLAGAAFVASEFVAGAAVMVYLLSAKSAEEVFVEQMDETPEGEGNSWELPYRERIKTWNFWRDLAIYFIVFSFVGHWAEMLFCRLIVAGVFMGGYDPTNAMLWDQWLFPFTAEGLALAMVVIALHPLKDRLLALFHGKVAPALVVSFLINAAVCTSIDFGTGMVANQNYELWDYRDMPFNFMGQVCLQNSLVYSIAATIVVWLAYPAMDRAIRRMPRSHANALFVALASIYAFEALLHFCYI